MNVVEGGNTCKRFFSCRFSLIFLKLIMATLRSMNQCMCASMERNGDFPVFLFTRDFPAALVDVTSDVILFFFCTSLLVIKKDKLTALIV